MMLKPSSGAIATGSAAGRYLGREPGVEFFGVEADLLCGDRLAGDRGRILVIDEHHRRPAIRDHRREELEGCRRRERRRDAPGAERADEHRAILDRGGSDDRHRLALLYAVALKCGGYAVHQPVKVSIMKHLHVRCQGDLRAPPLAGVAPDQIRQCGEFAGEQVGGEGWSAMRRPLGEA